ncbi:MAG: NAD-dependent epimerase/dehydratase family protein [Planctomycetes bacterium]|nr:NAD-dependent epimerase/dehydratase family protein [Planctomycetota bacterium]
MRVLVTGAGGFVGRALVAELTRDGGIEVRAASRSPISAHRRLTWVDSSGFGPEFDWRPSLDGVDAVVHLAGRAHVLRETSSDPEREFLAVNRDATRQLAEQSAGAGARHFVLVSTIGVHGDRSLPGKPLTEQDPLCPYDAYTRSKAEGEAVTLEVTAETATVVTILRPTMVYGPGAPGNFGRLVSLVRSGLPLPFGAIRNSRSFIARENLVSAIRCCLARPSATRGIFLLADKEDFSTPELIREIATGVGRKARLFPLHGRVLESGLRCIGRGALARRLLGSLQVDASLARNVLGWQPIGDARNAIRRAARETSA